MFIMTVSYEYADLVSQVMHLLFALRRTDDCDTGVDLEPDRPHQQLTNLTFRGCRYLNNAGAGFQTIADKVSSPFSPGPIMCIYP